MALGLGIKIVRLSPHTDEWEMLFQEEKERILNALGPLAVALEHVGSTAIVGIPAKPILDMALGLKDIARVRACVPPLEGIGYRYRGYVRETGGDFFTKGPKRKRTHYLHVVEFDGLKWRGYLLFRDYLRSHPDRRDAYARLKEYLADRFARDRNRYTGEKAEFIRRIIRMAEGASASPEA